MTSPARAHFGSNEIGHGLYNFHRPAELEEVEAVLSLPPERAPALVMIGDQGVGRRYLLHAAVLRRQQANDSIRYAGIDLEGFEPGQSESDFAKYLAHLESKYQRSDNARWHELGKWVGESKLKLTVRSAALVSVAFESTLSLAQIFSIFKDGSAVEGPLFRESEAFARQVSAIAGSSRLLVHVQDLEAAPGILIEWLGRLANREPGFYIAYSASRQAVNRVPGPTRRVELSPLERHEVRSVINARFSPHELPDFLSGLLHQYSEGWPSLIAAKMADLVGAGLVVCGVDGIWRLSADATPETLAGNFGDSVLDWFARTMGGAPETWRPAVARTMQLAALCGSSIPIRRLAEFQDLDEDAQDLLIDLLDELFESDGVLEDHGFGHPGFAGELIYSFGNPVIPNALRNGMRLSEREELAARLVQFLSGRVPRNTRGQARFYFHLASNADLAALSQELRRELEWFATMEDADALSSMLRSRVLEGSLDPAVLMQMEQRGRERWAPVNRLAVLDAICQPAPEGRPWDTINMPVSLLPAFLTAHAAALLDAGFYNLAYDRVAEVIGESDSPSPYLLNLRALCELHIGNYHEAIEDFDAVITAWSHDSNQTLGLLTIKLNLAQTLLAVGEYEDARQLQSEVLESRVRLLGAEHLDTIFAKANLAGSLSALGWYEEARQLKAEVLESRARLLGAEHPHTLIAKDNLAIALSDLGLYEQARQLQSEVLETYSRVLGAEHPDTLIARDNLAVTLSNLGRYEEAQKLHIEVLEARSRLLGAEHPDTILAKANLAGTLNDLGQHEESQRLNSEVVEARTRLLGAEHPHTIIAKANLAGTLNDMGQYEESQRLKSEVVEARPRLLGAEHPDTISAKANLAVTMSNLARYEDARKLELEVLEARRRLLGAEHPYTLRAKANLAATLSRLGRYEEARQLQSEVLEARMHLLGAEHPDTVLAKNNLAALLRALEA